jgi:predicted Fe-Mo cluster-binding NifX family protein
VSREELALIAVPEFRGRVSPTFDFCHRVTLWRVDGSGARRIGTRRCRATSSRERLAALLDAGVEVLLCGAIAPETLEELERIGIDVVKGVSGPVATVVAAYVCGALDQPQFRLPGYELAASR